MKLITRGAVHHHPFYQMYDWEADVRWRRDVRIVGAAAIHFVTILAVLFPRVISILGFDESSVQFVVEGYCLSLFYFLRGMWTPNCNASPWIERIMFALGFLFVLEIPICLIVILESLAGIAP